MTYAADPPLHGPEFRRVITLYSKDGMRAVGVLESNFGATYLDEREWIEGAGFKNRHGERLVGPFSTPKDAENFIAATRWFKGPRKLWRLIVLIALGTMTGIVAMTVVVALK